MAVYRIPPPTRRPSDKIAPFVQDPQLARPDGDITAGWTTSTGSGTHASHVDETTPDDSDYIYATAASQTAEVSLGALTDPGHDQGIIVRYRVRGVLGGARVEARLYQSTTLISTDPTVRSAVGTYEWNVPTSESANITDFNDLRVRLISLAPV